MFETAIRAAAGPRRPTSTSSRVSELWSALQRGRRRQPGGVDPRRQVGRGDPHHVGQQPHHRRCPYRKYMNSNNDVDMGAAIIIVLGRGGRAPRRRRGPLGVPALRHRLPRAPVRLQPRHVRPHAGHRARRQAGARAGRRRHRRHRHRRPLLVLPVGRAARRPVARPVDRPPADPHRRAAVRRRAVEQLRDARHRHGRATTSASSPASTGLVWANGGYATKHAFGVYGTEPPAERLPPRLPAGRDRRPAQPGAGRAARTPPVRRRSRPTRSCTAARARRSRRSPPACSPTAAGPGACPTDADVMDAMRDGEWVGRRRRPRRRRPPATS